MKKILLASVATGALALAGGVTGALTTVDSANAADLRMPLKAPPPPAPVFSWSGCYVGAHWGWGWGKQDAHGFYTTADHRFGGRSTLGSFNSKISGPLFGGQVGCDYQWPGSNFVIGVEGSYAGADIHNFGINNLSFDPGTPPFLGGHTRVDGLGSVTGKIGWNGWDPQVLFYIKGGWAWAHEKNVFFNDLSVSSGLGPLDQNRSGWTVGAGVEWAFSFAPRWSAFVEYDYYDFNNHKTLCIDSCDQIGSPGEFIHYTTLEKLTINTVKIGVNYKLWSPF
jgi:outer membrane immunogenic protein